MTSALINAAVSGLLLALIAKVARRSARRMSELNDRLLRIEKIVPRLKEDIATLKDQIAKGDPEALATATRLEESLNSVDAETPNPGDTQPTE